MVSVKFTKPSIDISPAWGLCIWLSKFLVVVPNIMKSLERVTFSTNSMESSAVESRNHLIYVWSSSQNKVKLRLSSQSAGHTGIFINGLQATCTPPHGFCPNLQMGEIISVKFLASRAQKSVFHCSQEASRQPRLQPVVVFRLNVTGCRQSSPQKEEALSTSLFKHPLCTRNSCTDM